MASTPPERGGPTSGPLAGMRWALESPGDHWARHDREQVRYWLSRPPAERLARADSYRVRVYGEGPYTLTRTFKWLNRCGVDYVVIASEAVAFHGVPRFSVDFDVFVRPTTANLFRVKAALEASGLGDLSEVDPEVWAKSGALFRIGESPLQIDILLHISGIDYHAAATDAVEGAYGDVPVRFLGRDSLIKNKKASGRPKDLADVDLLTSDEPDTSAEG